VVVDRIKRKIAASVKHTPEPVLEGEGDVGIIHFGSTSFAVDEARAVLARDGLPTRSLRVRALPLHAAVAEFVRSCRMVYVAEQNRDGQLADIIRLAMPDEATKVRSILEYGGLPMPASVVLDAVRAGLPEPAHV
jgi:2-oxoglutarate ferredoxin oxidoreductase subunit alpha